MNFIAFKMLVEDKRKFLGLVAGLAFAAILVTQQGSIFCGFALRSGSWIRDTNCCDLWVMNDQTEFSESGYNILDTALNRVRGISGVMWAVPMYRGFLRCRLPDGSQTVMRVIGLDDATLMGGPPILVQGRLADLRSDRAVFVNEDQLTDQLRLNHANPPRPMRVGDRLSVNDHDTRIAGTFRTSPDFFWQSVLYTTYTRALAIAPAARQINTFVLVKVQPGQSISEVAQRIRKIPGLTALTNEQFAILTMNYVLKKTGILIDFGLTIGMGFLIGALISGQTLYNFMQENSRHFAALKAMGAGTWTLVRMVCLQISLAGGLGYGIGVGLAALSGTLLSHIGLAFLMPWQVPVLGALAILVCCLIAGGFSLMRVIRLEPAIVFKA